MQFHNLKKNTANRKAKQVGRGGKRGKTSGRGTKGQNARSGRKKRPEMRDFIKKIPKLRGRGKNFLKSRLASSTPIKLEIIESKFEAGDLINVASLIEKGIVSKRNDKAPKVKVLGAFNLTKALSFEGIDFSASAKKSVESAKGSIKS